MQQNPPILYTGWLVCV